MDKSTLDNIEALLQQMRDQLSTSATEAIEDPVVDQPEASEVEAIAAQFEQLRQKLQVPDSISNSKLLELVVNNKYIPEQTTSEERRTWMQAFRDWLGGIDDRWMSWTNTWSGKVVFYMTIAAVAAVLIAPMGMERQTLFNLGYKSAAQRCEAGLQP